MRGGIIGKETKENGRVRTRRKKERKKEGKKERKREGNKERMVEEGEIGKKQNREGGKGK